MQQVVDLTAWCPIAASLYARDRRRRRYQPCDAQICAALTAAAPKARNEVTCRRHFHGEPQLHSFDFTRRYKPICKTAPSGSSAAPPTVLRSRRRRDGTTDSQLARPPAERGGGGGRARAADAALALARRREPAARRRPVGRAARRRPHVVRGALAWERSRGQVSVGLRGDLAARLPRWRFGAGGGAGSSGGDDASCPICLEEYAAGDELITFPCAHVYHAKCGTEWLRQKPNCPTCQFDVAEALKRA